MRFVICPFFKPGENIPWTETIRMMREQARLAEETCFTTAWFTEHLVTVKTRNHRSGLGITPGLSSGTGTYGHWVENYQPVDCARTL